MDANVVTPMLTLFRSDEPSYQPLHPSKSLQPEDGDPQASLENLKRLGLADPGDLGPQRDSPGS